ncbi:condensation domain-containing protein [Exiguobacterium sp. s189]|uniref:condensation domain-containing protein n=1 Tax=Exiguobacterium sp. s189 TaxID=2751263 RepID=UPI001BE616E3|nr:condensation domain-containing protein [Exiguobacterium sp. s189]
MNLLHEEIELTPVQRGIFFESIANPDQPFYHIQSIYELGGEFNLENLLNSAKRVMHNNPIFRTSFYINDEGNVVQKVHEDVDVQYKIIDSAELKDNRSLQRVLTEDLKEGFDLSKPELIRGIILKNNTEPNFKIIISYHHILIDGWSAGLVRNQFLETYDLLNQGLPLKDEPINEVFLKYCHLSNQSLESDITYWEDMLDGYKPYEINSLSNYKVNQNLDTFQRNFMISTALSKKVIEFSKVKRLTVSTLCLAFHFKFLSAIRNTNDITIGIVTSGREFDEIMDIENAVGCMIKIIPIRIKDIDKKDLESLAIELQDTVLMSIYHSNNNLTSYNHLINKTEYNEQLFSELYLYENYPLEAKDFKTFSLLDNYAVDKNGFPSVTYYYYDNQNIEIEFQVHSHFSNDLITYQTLMFELISEEFSKNLY